MRGSPDPNCEVKRLPEDMVGAPTPMGLRQGIDPELLNQLADELEADSYDSMGRRL